jgi:hypothetical protein
MAKDFLRFVQQILEDYVYIHQLVGLDWHIIQQNYLEPIESYVQLKSENYVINKSVPMDQLDLELMNTIINTTTIDILS